MAIMIRADIEEYEWRALRKLAIDLKKPIQTVIADALRKSSVTGKALRDAA